MQEAQTQFNSATIRTEEIDLEIESLESRIRNLKTERQQTIRIVNEQKVIVERFSREIETLNLQIIQTR